MRSGPRIAIVVALLAVAIYFVTVVIPSPPPPSGGGGPPPDPDLSSYIAQAQAASSAFVLSTGALKTQLDGVEGAVSTTFASHDSGVSDASPAEARKDLDPSAAATVKAMDAYVAEVAAYDVLVAGWTVDSDVSTMMSHKTDANGIRFDVTTPMANMVGLSGSISTLVSAWQAAYEVVSKPTMNPVMRGAINELAGAAATFNTQGALAGSAWKSGADGVHASYVALFNHLAGL
jgi:hypothetical protein